MTAMKTNQTIAPAYRQYADFIASVAADFDTAGTLVHDSRNQLRVVDAPDGSKWIVKRYKRPNIFQRAAFRVTHRSKATKAFQAAERLTQLGLATPETIASIDCVNESGALESCYFISAYHDYKELYELLVGNRDLSDELIDETSLLLRSMHERGVMHGDLNIRNILVNPGEGTRLYLIDNNRMRFLGRPLGKKERIKNMVRLTHERPVMHALVSRYATLMGWEAAPIVAAVERKLTRFERSRALRHRLKRLLPQSAHKLP